MPWRSDAAAAVVADVMAFAGIAVAAATTAVDKERIIAAIAPDEIAVVASAVETTDRNYLQLLIDSVISLTTTSMVHL